MVAGRAGGAVGGAGPLGLASAGSGHADPLCREAAVAALGAIGDPAGLAAVLAALEDKPAVRRRAAVALAAFEGPRSRPPSDAAWTTATGRSARWPRTCWPSE